MSFTCPNCGSENTQKVSVIFESGTTTVETTSSHTAVGMSKGGFTPIVGASEKKRIHQTQLATNLAPPQEKGIGGLLWLYVLAPILGFVALFVAIVADADDTIARWACFGTTLLIFGLITWGIVRVAKEALAFNRDEWPALHEEWKSKWFCHKGGEAFQPSAPANGADSVADGERS